MKYIVRISLVLLIYCTLFANAFAGNDLTCSELSASIKMAGSKSLSELRSSREGAGDSYRAKTIYIFKRFQLDYRDKNSAKSIIDNLPKDDVQYAVWMTMGDSLCAHESIEDMSRLDNFASDFPRLVSKAVLLVKGRIPRYINFSLLALQDPHSDLAMQMRKVCLVQHTLFLKAVERLPDEQGKVFSKHVMDASKCRVMNLPEAN
jgi:hypothetical protein